MSCFHAVFKFVCLKCLRTICQGGVQCVGGGKWDTLTEQGEEWVDPGSGDFFKLSLENFLVSLTSFSFCFSSISFFHHHAERLWQVRKYSFSCGNCKNLPECSLLYSLFQFLYDDFFTFCLFVLKLFFLYKERKFGVPIPGCGLSTSRWEVLGCSRVSWKMFGVGELHDLLTKTCALKAAKQHSSSPRPDLDVVLFSILLLHSSCSLFLTGVISG